MLRDLLRKKTPEEKKRLQKQRELEREDRRKFQERVRRKELEARRETYLKERIKLAREDGKKKARPIGEKFRDAVSKLPKIEPQKEVKDYSRRDSKNTKPVEKDNFFSLKPTEDWNLKGGFKNGYKV